MPLAISSMRVPDWLFVIIERLPVCSLEGARECRDPPSRYNAGLEPAESARHRTQHCGCEADVKRDHPNDCAVELGVELAIEAGESGIELGFEVGESGVGSGELGVELGFEIGESGIELGFKASESRV